MTYWFACKNVTWAKVENQNIHVANSSKNSKLHNFSSQNSFCKSYGLGRSTLFNLQLSLHYQAALNTTRGDAHAPCEAHARARKVGFGSRFPLPVCKCRTNHTVEPVEWELG